MLSHNLTLVSCPERMALPELEASSWFFASIFQIFVWQLFLRLPFLYCAHCLSKLK